MLSFTTEGGNSKFNFFKKGRIAATEALPNFAPPPFGVKSVCGPVVG